MDTRCLIGLPQWQHTGWHPDRPDALTALSRYTRYFTSVEGNNSFYGAPKAETVQRWLDNTPEHFRFCFKVPRSISHDAPLTHSKAPLLEFLKGLETATTRLGMVWLQLSDKLGPDNLGDLAKLFEQLPSEFDFGLEVRHSAFFAKGDAERQLNALLMMHGVNRVMFDTRLLFADTATDAETREAQRKKPPVPLHVIATGTRPMVRFISPLDISRAEPALHQWANKVAQWIVEDKQPILFFHTPNNQTSPQLAYRFAEVLKQRCSDFQMPLPWPPVLTQSDLF